MVLVCSFGDSTANYSAATSSHLARHRSKIILALPRLPAQDNLKGRITAAPNLPLRTLAAPGTNGYVAKGWYKQGTYPSHRLACPETISFFRIHTTGRAK